MSKRSYAELIKQYETRDRRTFNWNWFGWLGIVCLLLFVSFLFFPDEFDGIRYPVASVTLIAAMLAGILLPVVSAVRGSKWWLLVSVFGLLAALLFFSVIAA